VSQKHVAEKMSAVVLRKGQVKRLRLTLRPPQYLVAEDRYDVKPSYYLFAGLLFVPLTRDYLKTWGQQWWNHAPHSLMAHYESDLPSFARQEVVVLQKVLADKVNYGYHHVESVEITHIQGKPLRSLKDLIKKVESDKSEHVRLLTREGFELVLDRVQGAMRTHLIMRRFGVPKDRSDDLKD
jgi:hypothetical protein